MKDQDDKTRIVDSASDTTQVSDEQTRLVTRMMGDDQTKIVNQAPTATIEQLEKIGVGSIIRDRFELVSPLGEGGMGAVFKAIDRRKQEAEDDNPYVAIKLLGEDFKAHPKAFVTLQREAKKTQALAHPNVVTVYDFDRDGDLFFMTMEELRGQTLQDKLAAHIVDPMPLEEGLSIVRGIAEGLAYAHRKGVVHSDLKPGNIFVTDEGVVKVLDFGIARILDESMLKDRFDVSELSALTPRYASVEMLNHQAPDPRDDIFALGIMACEILGGVHPYKRKLASEALSEALKPQLPRVGRLLEKALFKAIKLDKSARIESCEQLLKQLDFATSGYKKWIAGGVLIVLLAIGNVVYLEEVKAPLVDISELTSEQQESFHKNIQEAELAMSFDDINGAVFYLDKAYAIHSQNAQVHDLIEVILKHLEVEIDNSSLNQKEIESVVSSLGQYAAFQTEDHLSRLEALTQGR